MKKMLLLFALPIILPMIEPAQAGCCGGGGASAGGRGLFGRRGGGMYNGGGGAPMMYTVPYVNGNSEVRRTKRKATSSIVTKKIRNMDKCLCGDDCPCTASNNCGCYELVKYKKTCSPNGQCKMVRLTPKSSKQAEVPAKVSPKTTEVAKVAASAEIAVPDSVIRELYNTVVPTPRSVIEELAVASR